MVLAKIVLHEPQSSVIFCSREQLLEYAIGRAELYVSVWARSWCDLRRPMKSGGAKTGGVTGSRFIDARSRQLREYGRVLLFIIHPGTKV